MIKYSEFYLRYVIKLDDVFSNNDKRSFFGPLFLSGLVSPMYFALPIDTQPVLIRRCVRSCPGP